MALVGRSAAREHFRGGDFDDVRIHPGYMGWMMIGSSLFWIALVGLAIFAIIRFGPRERRDDATALLNERLARGDITAEEYRWRRALIVSH